MFNSIFALISWAFALREVDINKESRLAVDQESLLVRDYLVCGRSTHLIAEEFLK